ncbi:MAG TPA: DUF6632 domain-containing protein [Longimicrobiales bacterium]
MNENVKVTWLRWFLRMVAAGLLAAFIPWIILILVRAPLLAPGSDLAPLLRFQPYNANYESMLAGIYIVWAVTLWRASANPAEHRLFLDFTMWGSAAHGIVMIIATPLQKGAVMTFVESAPLLAIAAVLLSLRPRRTTLRGDEPSGINRSKHDRRVVKI